MRLICMKYGIDIELRENQVNTIVIENPDSMCDFVNQMVMASCNEETLVSLWSQEKQLPFSKTAELILDLFNIDFNNKKIITALYGELQENAASLDIEKAHINSEMIDLLDRIFLSEPYEGISYNLEFAWKDLFKLYDVRLDAYPDDALMRITEYIMVLSSICHVKVVFLLHAHSFFDHEKILKIYESAMLRKVHLVLIEPCEYEKEVFENICIIDKDNCNIYK